MSPTVRAGFVLGLTLCALVVGCRQGSEPLSMPLPTPAIVPAPDRSLATEVTEVPSTPTPSPTPPEATPSPRATRRAAGPGPSRAARVSGANSGSRSESPVQTAIPALPAGAEQPIGRSCPAEAPVKGSSARVYHTPASRTYETVLPVICFTSGSAAAAAGYRPASN